ncbi:MAG: N-acetylmuramoyl-L-alanine amidase [Coriobacteriales bacterium]|nr:N-acetylmuramoyl-L-alanine amidase [Coriobacteriales bacterium]
MRVTIFTTGKQFCFERKVTLMFVCMVLALGAFIYAAQSFAQDYYVSPGVQNPKTLSRLLSPEDLAVVMDTGTNPKAVWTLRSIKVTPAQLNAMRIALNIEEDFRDSFIHGYKGVEYQRYIVLHDTEGDTDPHNIVDYWDYSGQGVASHFVIGKDGRIIQCVDMDVIAHHTGYGDAGHNELYGVLDESRDDFVGTVPIGDWAPDYGMNSYSIGIEMVHVSGEGFYPEAQLQALDALIAYIDAYYGYESVIIDHKEWRSYNSDTSPEFADYLESYKITRNHDGLWR